MTTEIKKNIHWVGAIDWNVRDFHSYETGRGSTYNAYLLLDEKIALIDTVKAPFAEKLLENITALAEPKNIAYLVCNHAELDHAGSFPAVVAACPNAQVVCNQKCREALSRHFDTSAWKFKIVKSGESLSLGKRTLMFLDTPMVHWPESMFTYVPEEKLLFSMDAFGQHFASASRFDDENDLPVVMAEARTYYANIVMLYAKQIQRTLEEATKIAIEMIAPSHGVIWRSHIKEIVTAYQGWVKGCSLPKVLVIYDTMWQSTHLMAEAIEEGAASVNGVSVRLLHVRANSLTLLATETLDASAIAFGSPTLNMTLMPQMAAVLTYLQGLKPFGKAVFAFGSYGWAKGGPEAVAAALETLKLEILRTPITAQYVPTKAVLDECREAGKALALKALEKSKSNG